MRRAAPNADLSTSFDKMKLIPKKVTMQRLNVPGHQAVWKKYLLESQSKFMLLPSEPPPYHP